MLYQQYITYKNFLGITRDYFTPCIKLRVLIIRGTNQRDVNQREFFQFTLIDVPHLLHVIS